MISGISYRKTLFFYFLMVFVVFTSVITIVQYNSEKNYKVRELKSILETYTDITDNYIRINNIDQTQNFSLIDSISAFIPREDIRITVMANNGTVQYDSFHKRPSEMANHLYRQEFQNALLTNSGTDIRLSESTNQEFFYFAKKYDQYYIRAAALYTISIEEFLRVESLFWLLIAILFIITAVVLLYVSDTLGKSILKLKDFAVMAAKNESIDVPLTFPNNELGVISNQIVNIYTKLQNSNRALSYEREKLIQHIQISKEGIAIFSKNEKKVLANNFFIQYINLISDSTATEAEEIINIKEFKPIKDFIHNYSEDNSLSLGKQLPVKRLSISKNMRYFDVQCIVFHDRSYEISISDVTQSVKQKKLKQEMTSNIAHELRTPVSSIKGYMETILTAKEIAPDKLKYFIERASAQIERLSELIRDISVLTKMEESSDLFQMESISIKTLINDVVENLHPHIQASNAKLEINVEDTTKIQGNRALLFSVFQNLIENAINYAGDNISIVIKQYLEDKDKVYFSVADNGMGIEEKHQPRIFERFYRVEKGRNRETGGTGLGLAIVKHAIGLHGNKINVKTRKGGGAEFLFALNKE